MAKINYKEMVKNLSHQTKKNKIKSFKGKELEFQKHLKIAFQNKLKESGAYQEVKILQGPNEEGKDLLIPYKTPLDDYEAAAVVVKIDDIKGSVNKENEIIGQISQCATLEAYYDETSQPITIRKIYLVVGGTLSKGARDKIIKMIRGVLDAKGIKFKPMGIEDVIKFFEEYYPEFFLSDSIKTLIKEKINDIEEFLTNEKELNYFIEPTLRKREKFDKKEIIKYQIIDSKQDYLDELHKEAIGEHVSFNAFCKELLEDKRKKIILTGDAGSGKSVLLFKAVENILYSKIDSVEQEKYQVELPIIINAVDFNDTDLKKYSSFETKILNFYNQSEISSNLLVIDGIDEVKKEKRDKIKNFAEQYQERFDLTLIFSSRNNFSVVESFEDYIKYDVLPYEISKALDFLKRALLQEQNIVNYLTSRLEELESNFPLYPLSLKLLIKILSNNKEIPASITELYKDYIEIVLGKFEFTKKVEVDKFFEYRIKEDFFKELSYKAFFLKNKTKITKEEFDSFINEFIAKQSIKIEKSLFKEAIFRTGLLVEKEEISFSHKSFLDFFISSYFHNNIMDLEQEEREQLYKVYTNSEWEDVFLFYIGKKQRLSEKDIKLLKREIENQQSEFIKHFHYYFLGKVLQYGWLTETQIKSNIIEEASQFALPLVTDFKRLLSEHVGVEVPEFIPSIIVHHLTDLFYSSEFLRKEILNLLENKLGQDDEKNIDARLIGFATFYITNNENKIEKEKLTIILKKLLKDINLLAKKKDFLRSSVLIALFLKFASDEDKMVEDVKQELENMIYKFRKNFPDLFASVITYKKSDYLKTIKKIPSKKKK